MQHVGQVTEEEEDTKIDDEDIDQDSQGEKSDTEMEDVLEAEAYPKEMDLKVSKLSYQVFFVFCFCLSSSGFWTSSL